MGRGDEEDGEERSDEGQDAGPLDHSAREAERAMAWQSMRILKRFSLPDLLRTVPGAEEDSLRRWVKELVVRGYVRQRGWTGPKGSPEAHRVWHLVRATDEPAPPRLSKRQSSSRQAPSLGKVSNKALPRSRTLQPDDVGRVEEEKWAEDELRRLLLEFEAALASAWPGAPHGTTTSRWARGRPERSALLGAAA